MRVFVLLPAHLDVDRWRAQYKLGKLPDLVPYGYQHADGDGCTVAFSAPTPIGSGVVGLARRLLNRILGCEIVHAFHNRAALSPAGCDIIWTHTEREHLAVRLIEALSLGRIRAAPMIAQSVWLMDKWNGYSALRRSLYRKLLRRSEILTFLSPANAEAARRCGFGVPVEVMPFGVSHDTFPLTPPKEAQVRLPIRVFTLGQDVHRDWETFAAAFGDDANFDVRVASPSYPPRLSRKNIQVRVMDVSEVTESYRWADVVVVPLKPNLHASGITVLFEAATLGVPVVVSDVGGLRYYFSDDEVTYVPGRDPERLRQVVKSIMGSIAGAKATSVKAAAAQKRLVEADYSSRGYALRHVALSRRIVGHSGEERRDAPNPAVAHVGSL